MTDITYDFDGKVVFITGGGSGIGRASSLAFGRSGAKVAVADISEPSGQAVVAEIEEAGGTAKFFHVDVADLESVHAAVAAVIAQWGRLDIAHNNAGIEGKNVPLAEVESQDWQRVIDVDLTSVFFSLKAEIPVMLAQGGGAIVNTASASGLIGGFNLATYTAAKHGVVGLTKAAAMDYGDKGIRINAICPGPIDTPFISSLPKEALDQLISATPIGRLGQADEIAQAVLWLTSSGSSYMLGHSLPVDGGVVLSGVGTKF